MSIWQTQSWQDMLIASGQSEGYFVVERDIKNTQKKDYKEVFVEKRRVSLGEYGLFVVGFEGKIDENLKENLEHLCKEEKCLFYQVETLNYNIGEAANVEGYYKKFIPPYTTVIDLEKSEDDILAAMKPKGRYNIRLARKKGVKVSVVEKTQENIKIFHELMQVTNLRDKFSGNTLVYYQTFLEKIPGSELLFAQHEGDIIAAGIFVFTKEVSYYYYGASSNHKRNLMAPYLLQWTAIEHARETGSKIYDFLGVSTPGDKNSSLAGVTDFKMKLSLDIRKVSTSFLYVNKTIKHHFIQILKRIKK